MAPQVVTAEKRYRISLLLDAYGGLLTEKQRTFLKRYYEEDYSFGEIARDFSVSRQAIHDAVKHGEAALESYERELQLVRAGLRRPRAGENGGPASNGAGPVKAAQRLTRLAGRLLQAVGEEAARPFVKELNEIARSLETSGGAPAHSKSQPAPAPFLRGGPDVD